MIWYQALIPAAAIAIAVRLEAILLLPYWSWLQLIPAPEEIGGPTEQKERNQALMRRTSIPLLAGIILVAIWPSTYGPTQVAVVAALGAGLLLWPLVFAAVYFDEVRTPPWVAWLLYALLPIVFAASGALGGVAALSIHESGGVLQFIRDEVVSWLIPAVLILFGNAAFRAGSSRLAKNRQHEYFGDGESDN